MYNDDKKDFKWQVRHLEVMKSFLTFLYKSTTCFVLKGGTSLLLCYGLDRFSEDIDLDGKALNNRNKTIPSIIPFVKKFCEQNGFTCNVKKDTDFVERCMIDYGEEKHKLKVEVSYREVYNLNVKTQVNNDMNIIVYDINTLARMKIKAVDSRAVIRDFYDLCFITNNFWDKLTIERRNDIISTFAYNNFEYVDYLVETQKDDLVNADKLRDMFLDTFDKTKLLFSESEMSKDFKTLLKTPNKGGGRDI